MQEENKNTTLTASQKIAEWKKKTAHELWKTYTPKLLRKEITQKAYDLILSYASDRRTRDDGERPVSSEKDGNHFSDKGDAVATICETFNGYEITTHTEPTKGVSQKDRLLEVLGDGEWHDTVEILHKVYETREKGGIARVGARVYDLKNDGYAIESRKKDKTIWEYRLNSSNTKAND